MRKFLLVFIILLFASPSFGAIFYVDCSVSGGTAGAGTFADPFESIADVEAYESATNFADGDDIYFLEGSTCTMTSDWDLWHEGVDGDNYSIIGCYDGENDFDCDGTRPILTRDTGATGAIVEFKQAISYVRFEDVQYKNSGASWDTQLGDCIRTLPDNNEDGGNNDEGYLIFENNYFYHCSFYSIQLARTGTNSIVTNNEFVEVGQGVYFIDEYGGEGASYGYVANNTCTDIRGKYDAGGNKDGHCISLQTTDHFIVEDNVSTDAYNVTYILWTHANQSSIHNVFNNNTSNGNRQTGISLFHDSTSGDTGAFGNLVYQNILKSDADETSPRPSIRINSYKGANGNYVFNNTSYDSGYHLWENRRGVDYSYWFNNIGVPDGVGPSDNEMFFVECNGDQGSNHYIQNNIFWSVPNTDPSSSVLWYAPNDCDSFNFANWEADSANISNNVVDNPDFVDTTNFELDAGSPAINAGRFLTNVTSAASSGTTVNVANTYILHDNKDLVDADGVAIDGMLISFYDETSGIQNAEITGITYGTSITFTPSVDWIYNAGSPTDPATTTQISLRMAGTAPDIGALEYPEGGVYTKFYVDNTCTDNNVGSATPDGLSYDPVTPACTGGDDAYYVTIADLNAASFNAGDTIYFRKGQTWRETWYVYNAGDGTSGNPITYTNFGTGDLPKISGGVVFDGSWANTAGDEYKIAMTTETHFVINGSTILTEGTAGSLAANEWDWDSNELHVNIGEDPTGGDVEAAQLSIVILLAANATTDGNHITVDGFRVELGNGQTGANRGNISVWGDTPEGITIQNCEVYWFPRFGIAFYGNSVTSNSVIDGNTVNGGSGAGIAVAGWDNADDLDTITISDNTISDIMPAYATETYGYGIETFYATNLTISGNDITTCNDAAIKLDGDATDGVDSSLITKNKIVGSFGVGIILEKDSNNNVISYNYIDDYATITGLAGIYAHTTCDNNQFLYNLVANGGSEAVAGIEIINDSINSLIYGNVVYASSGDNGIYLSKSAGTSACTGTKVKNNIVYKNGGANWALTLDCAAGGWVGFESDYNILEDSGKTDVVYVADGSGTYDCTIAEWAGQSDTCSGITNVPASQGGNSQDADPLFTNAGSGDFTLQSTSPALDAGVDLTATFDDALDPASTFPSSVTTLDQDLHGLADTTQSTPADEATDVSVNPNLNSLAFAINGAWDIGAYVFESPAHTKSQWQIDADAGDFSSPVYDSGESNDLISHSAVAGLSASTAYDWRVRHKTAAGWGAWTTKFDFTTAGAPPTGGGALPPSHHDFFDFFYKKEVREDYN